MPGACSDSQRTVIGHQEVSVLVNSIRRQRLGGVLLIGAIDSLFALFGAASALLGGQRQGHDVSVEGCTDRQAAVQLDLLASGRSVRRHGAISPERFAPDSKRFPHGRALTLFGVGAFPQALARLLGGNLVADVPPHAIGTLSEEAPRGVALANRTNNLACHIGLVHLCGADVVGTMQRNNVTESAISRVAIGHASVVQKTNAEQGLGLASIGEEHSRK